MRQAYVDRLVDYTLTEPGAETGAGASPWRVAAISPGEAHYVWIDLPHPPASPICCSSRGRLSSLERIARLLGAGRTSHGHDAMG